MRVSESVPAGLLLASLTYLFALLTEDPPWDPAEDPPRDPPD